MSIPVRLFILALVLRMIPLIVAINLPIGLDDMFQYDMLGRSIAAGKGFRWYAQEDLDLLRSYIDLEFVVGEYDPQGVLASFRAPGYPAFLALIYSISGLGQRILAARIVQTMLGASLAPLGYLIALRLFPKSRKGAIFTGFSLAAYPMLVIYPLALATENLFIPLLFAGFLALLKAGQDSRRSLYLLSGTLFGLATLTRSVIFGFVGLAFLWIWLLFKDRRGAFLFTAAALLLVTPWVLRNTLLHGKFTFVENSLGYNLHMGYHPEGSGTFQYGISLELFPYLDDGLRNDLGMQMGSAFIQENPGRVPQLMLNKLGYFFALERRALSYFYSNGFFGHIPQAPLVGLFIIFTMPLAILSTLSVLSITMMQWTKQGWLLLLLLLAYLFPHILLLAEPRFHLAIVPALAVFAGYAWEKRHHYWQVMKVEKWRMAFFIFLIAMLYLNWGLELWRDADKLQLLLGPDGHRTGFPY